MEIYWEFLAVKQNGIFITHPQRLIALSHKSKISIELFLKYDISC